jgi:peptidoglycan/xylan/chitin deacetylase (PgdA/CDA1 family)
MFKRISLFIICSMLVLFSGCSNQDQQKSSSNDRISSAKSSRTASSNVIQSSSRALETGSETTVPVLMYHSITYVKDNTACVSKEIFEQQMKWLDDNGYKTLTLDELNEHLQTNAGFPQKCVIITFDDGYSDNYSTAFPILKKYDFKATIFMISSNINTSNYLTEQQLKEMSKSVFSIQGHTVTHPYLNKLTEAKQYEELADSKATLEAITGKKVEFLAYPYGKYNSDSIHALKTLGYKLAFRMSGGFAKLSDKPYELPRVYVGNNLDKFIAAVENK